MASSAGLPDHPARRWRSGDPVALVVALALIAVSALVGQELVRRGLVVVLPTPPLVAYWHPHLGWGTPLAIGCILLGLRVRRAAAWLSWRRLVITGWLLNLAWMCSLTLVDGLQNGWVDVLLDPNEYLADLPRITDPATFLASFSNFIAFGPGVDGDNVWTTHVAGHPPLATLVFWALAQVGLSGGFWAGALCILVSSAVSVALPITLRELGAADAARRLVPFIALFPGAVWMAVSADGLFAGVATSGLALVCLGASRGTLPVALAGGLLLGVLVFLSYGLVLFGIIVLVALLLTGRAAGMRPIVLPWLAATVGVLTIAFVHLGFGFNWIFGLQQLRIRYYQGIASERPFSYFVYANLAAWLISCSPLLAVVMVRAAAALIKGRGGGWTQDRIVALICLSGVTAALVADLSALSKAETERIWLTFGVAASTGFALLRGQTAGWALLGSAGWALVVNHLLETGW